MQVLCGGHGRGGKGMGRLFALVRAPAFMIADDLLQVAFKMFFGINADGIGNKLHSVLEHVSHAARGSLQQATGMLKARVAVSCSRVSV